MITAQISLAQNADVAPQLTACQGRIVGLLGARPDRYLPASKDLDNLLNGEMTSGLADSLMERHIWFDCFLESVEFWRRVSDQVLEIRNLEGDEFGPNPAFLRQRAELSRLLGDVMAGYVPAVQESSPYSADWCIRMEATEDLLKRYRRYSRYVEEFTIEMWPGVDRKLLCNPDFGWVK